MRWCVGRPELATAPVRTRSGGNTVVMVKPAQHGHGYDSARGRAGRAWCRIQKLASDAFGSPQSVLGNNPSNEGDDVRRDLRLPPSIRFRLAAPEEPETGTVPPQNGLGFDQQHSVTPPGYQAGQQYQQASLVRPARWPFHLPRHDDELLAEQGVFGDELPTSPQDIARQTGDQWQRSGGSPEGSAQLRLGVAGKSSKLSANQGNTIVISPQPAERTSLVLDRKLVDPGADAKCSQYKGVIEREN